MDSPQFPLEDPHLQQTYDSLRNSDAEPGPNIITISGERAVGTSTHATDLGAEFGIPVVSAGDLQREKAEEHGYETAHAYRSAEPDADQRMDGAILERAYSGEPVILEGRLAGAALSASRGDKHTLAEQEPIAPVRVNLTAPDRERGKRYLMRNDDVKDIDQIPGDTADAVFNELSSADEHIYESFEALYGIDGREDRHYTHIIDTTAYRASHRTLVSAVIDELGLTPKRLDAETLATLGP